MLIEQTEHLMATTISVHLVATEHDEVHARLAIKGCMAWFADVATRFTRFTADSELSQLNAATGSWHPVSESLFTVVAESIAAAKASAGRFDPALLPLLEALGYDRDFARFAHREARSAWRVTPGAADTGRWREIALDASQRRVRLPEGARLDLGGIVKGWAADVALEQCCDGCADVLINVGGDMRARGGSEEDHTWAIGIGDTRQQARDGVVPHAAVITLGAGGLATSGATDRWWYRGGERQHHLIDPLAGRPAQVWIDPTDDRDGTIPLIATATALAPTAAHAEVAAKVALLRGYPKALKAVDHAWKTRNSTPQLPYRDGDVALLLILGNGAVECSTNFPTYLDLLGGGGQLWRL